MNDVIIVLLSIFGGIILLITVIFLIVHNFTKHGKTEEMPLNRPFVFNLTNHGSNVLYQEIRSELKESGNRNNLVLCKSFEVQLDKDKNPVLPPKAFEPSWITTTPNRRIPLARGTLDEDSEIILYLPENLNNVDESFKNTKLFKMIEPLILQNDALDNTIRSFVRANQRNKEMIDMLIASNLDEKVIQKLRVIKTTINEAEQNVPSRQE